MGRSHSIYVSEVYKIFRKRLVRDLYIDGSVILKCILKKYGGKCTVDWFHCA
jgi:hypothetical protein